MAPLQYHWNEDPHSVPNPLVGGKAHNYEYHYATEPQGPNPQFFEPYNKGAAEPVETQSHWAKPKSTHSVQSLAQKPVQEISIPMPMGI